MPISGQGLLHFGFIFYIYNFNTDNRVRLDNKPIESMSL